LPDKTVYLTEKNQTTGNSKGQFHLKWTHLLWIAK